jgi:hypothetical protein
VDADLAGDPGRFQRPASSGFRQICAGNRDVRSYLDGCPPRAQERDFESVCQRNRVEYRPDLVIAVRALAEYGEREVDLGEGLNAEAGDGL